MPALGHKHHTVGVVVPRPRIGIIGIALLGVLASCADQPVAGDTGNAASSTVPPVASTVASVISVSPLDYVPDGVEASSPCLERAVFVDPASSPYRLPFAPGRFFLVTQSYCYSAGGDSNQLVYDFALPIGEPVLAARSGTAVGLRADSPDDGRGNGEHNFVFIQHADGSVAFYAHLMQDSVLVEIGESVAAGDPIASSGNSGLTGQPHLHFGVYRGWPPREGSDLPVNFSNAAGRLDGRGGLIEGLVYEALG